MEQPAWDRSLPSYRLSRLFRTASSEIYLVWDQDERVAQVDLHYNEALRLAFMTIVVESALSQEELEGLVHLIDQEIISSHLSEVEREDLGISIYQGQELVSYHLGEESDDFWAWLDDGEDEWEQEEEDEER